VQDILTGKCFDNGTICASEQSVVIDGPIESQVREQFKLQGAHFLSPAEAEQLGKIVATPQRSLNAAIVGKSVTVIAQMAGLNVPPGTRCLMADVGGVGRDYPLSLEKLSPILSVYVVDGLEQGAQRSLEVLRYGGMGHTAGIHTRSRDAAIKFGGEMPASRITVNTPTTHGAIGFSTALPPSMTLGCGSWGGNVTSDNVSPLHLMDIKRVAFETRPVKSARPAVNIAETRTPPAPVPEPVAVAPSAAPKIGRQEIAAIVDRFLAGRPTPPAPIDRSRQHVRRAGKCGAGRFAPQAAANGGAGAGTPIPASEPAANGRKAIDFVSEDDVRRAIQKGEKIYVGPRTIITPAARDMGEPAEVFAKA
jgi:acetaldehyde dehydrogenase (acetylating)